MHSWSTYGVYKERYITFKIRFIGRDLIGIVVKPSISVVKVTWPYVKVQLVDVFVHFTELGDLRPYNN